MPFGSFQKTYKNKISVLRVTKKDNGKHTIEFLEKNC